MNLQPFLKLSKRGVFAIHLGEMRCLVYHSENMLDCLSRQLKNNRGLKNHGFKIEVLLEGNQYDNLKEEYERICMDLRDRDYIIKNYRKAVNYTLVYGIIERDKDFLVEVVLRDPNYTRKILLGLFDNVQEAQEFAQLAGSLHNPNSIRAYNEFTKRHYETT